MLTNGPIQAHRSRTTITLAANPGRKFLWQLSLSKYVAEKEYELLCKDIFEKLCRDFVQLTVPVLCVIKIVPTRLTTYSCLYSATEPASNIKEHFCELIWCHRKREGMIMMTFLQEFLEKLMNISIFMMIRIWCDLIIKIQNGQRPASTLMYHTLAQV